jgi:hypothetical protein
LPVFQSAAQLSFAADASYNWLMEKPNATGMISLNRRTIAGDWLAARLEEKGARQNKLASYLDVTPALVNFWIKGTDAIPPKHLPSIVEYLRLSDGELRELYSVVDIQAFVNELYDLFLPLAARPKPKKIAKAAAPTVHGIGQYFHYPIKVFARLLAYCQTLAASDRQVNADRQTECSSVRLHIAAACRVVKDIDRYLLGCDSEGKKGTTLWTPDNIWPHLTYPFNYYMAFFIDHVGEADGDYVSELKQELLIAFASLADFSKSQNRKDNIVAQHALYMLSRHGTGDDAHRYASMKRSKDVQAKRMALFGEAFRLGDKGPFDELCSTIRNDDLLALAVIAFDGLHYGDYTSYDNSPNAGVVPTHALVRHMHSLSDCRIFIRQLASIRIRGILDRYSDKIQNSDTSRMLIADKLLAIRGRAFDDMESQAAFEKIDQVMTKAA